MDSKSLGEMYENVCTVKFEHRPVNSETFKLFSAGIIRLCMWAMAVVASLTGRWRTSRGAWLQTTGWKMRGWSTAQSATCVSPLQNVDITVATAARSFAPSKWGQNGSQLCSGQKYICVLCTYVQTRPWLKRLLQDFFFYLFNCYIRQTCSWLKRLLQEDYFLSLE